MSHNWLGITEPVKNLRRMRSKHFVVLLLALLSMRLAGVDCGCAYAGDEVDYSAPYITVENGKLVTRYPTKEHAPDDAPVQTDVDEVAEPPEKEPLSLLLWGLIAAIAVVLSILARYALLRRKINA